MRAGRIHLILHLAAAAVLALAAGFLFFMRDGFFSGSALQLGTIVAATIVALLGLVLPSGRVATLSANICLSFLTFFVILSMLEAFFRLIGHDFAKEEQTWRRTPLYYRQPIFPTGEVFFRRPGPEKWTGQVLNARLDELHVSPNPYRDESTITVSYDATGFRHEEGFTDWEIAIAGDSFTELGYLPYDQLFTTILGKLTNLRVLNLGTGYTGPLTQLSYLRDYGLAPGTRRAVIVFFEGNDLEDLDREYGDLMRYQSTGHRPLREFKKQTSVTRALFKLVESIFQRPPRSWVTAYFKSARGDVPITLLYIPPARDQLPPEAVRQLNYFFERFAAFGKDHHVEVWLVFMPCKERVVYGMVEFCATASEKLKKWEPTDLPIVISDLSQGHGVRFMDLTPMLREETHQSGELLYNSIYDTHLNARGSQAVAREMARQLFATDEPR